MSKIQLSIAFSLGILSAALPALAEPQRAPTDASRVEARKLADEGQRFIDAGDYKSALSKLEEAETRFAAPTIKIAEAEVHEKLGELCEAKELYDRVANESLDAGAPEEFREAQKQAARESARLGKLIPHIVLALVGPEPALLTLTLDGRAMSAATWNEPMAMNPGAHALVVEMAGRKTQLQRLTLKEGETRRIEIRAQALPKAESPLPPAPPPEPPRSYTLPVVAFGVGAAGLVAGVVGGGVALSKMASFKRACGPELSCPPSFQSDLDNARVAGHVSTVGFATFGVGAALGAALLLWPTGTKEKKDAVKLGVGPSGMTLEGSF